MERNEGIGRLCRNGWVHLAVLDPATRAVQRFRGRSSSGPTSPRPSVLPKAASSVDWYRGWRDHLEFAEIDARARCAAAAEERMSMTDDIIAASFLGLIVVVSPLLLDDHPGGLVAARLEASRADDHRSWSRRRSSRGCWRRRWSWA